MTLKDGIDWKAQKTAQDLCTAVPDKGALENLATKTLGIVQENGLYASILFLHTRRDTEKPFAQAIMKQLHTLTTAFAPDNAGKPDVSSYLKFYTDNITCDLDKMLLVRAAWEQALIYTRYAAKALKASSENTSTAAPQTKKG